MSGYRILSIFTIGFLFVFFTSCGFQSRKYTHGHYGFDSKVHSRAVEMLSLTCQEGNIEKDELSAIVKNDAEGVIGVGEEGDQLLVKEANVPVQSTMSDEQYESVGADTTIKGKNDQRIDLPNQSETPAILEEHFKKSKKYANRYFGVTGLLFAAMVGLQVAFSQSSSIYSSSLYLSMLVAYVLMLFTFLYFRGLWKKPYQSLSDGLRSYRKFNEQEKWYKALDNRVFSLDFLIVLSVLMTVFAFFILITPLYGGY